MIDIGSRCTGCGVCATVCPKKCISMVSDFEGFLYPKVDIEKCINCKTCIKICHILNVTKGNFTEKPAAFVGYNKDENIRLNSSSGGIFTAISLNIFKQSGVVYGAALSDMNEVKHIRVDKPDTLRKLRGSKYVQSRIDDGIYTAVKTDLSSGKPVLYSGTPCQIGALRGYLKKDYDNLFTVSFICHGVPSPLVWEKYIDYQEIKHKSALNQVSFRNKDEGWTTFSMKLSFVNGDVYRKNLKEDLYLKAFLKNTCLRPSCHSCQYKGIEHQKIIDIILADWWGADQSVFADIDMGISAILINNTKGHFLWNNCCSALEYKEMDFNRIIASNTAYSMSTTPSKYRSRFLDEIRYLQFEKTVQKYTKTPLKQRIKQSLIPVIYLFAKKTGLLKLYKIVRCVWQDKNVANGS
ncbi:MAG: NADH dehydrogenase subunit I [Firmicutes bacterium ADurb.Bin419]|nr:MAG: NADH dehydrogenase subunit I [Firmicutes bacterium ADurb.Bin419]